MFFPAWKVLKSTKIYKSERCDSINGTFVTSSLAKKMAQVWVVGLALISGVSAQLDCEAQSSGSCQVRHGPANQDKATLDKWYADLTS
jgi:hypothetical protein